MGEQHNLTEENVSELIKHLYKMKETNHELDYSFWKQKELEEDSDATNN